MNWSDDFDGDAWRELQRVVTDNLKGWDER